MNENMKINLSEIYGSNVFNDAVMRERLPKETYKSLRKTISEGAELDSSIADVVANAMKDWAIERGATHFTHWFQPMTDVTAEKHDSFLEIDGNGAVITELSGKSLIKGEPDASSFPNGGLRATFEARGYTAWDCTSPAFLKEDAAGVTLCIPTAFCSYTGFALDKKTPLLKSMDAINKQALRILRLFGNTTTNRVIPVAGAEQEYFLIDKKLYDKRPDLMYTGRTLFGVLPPKGQEMDDHYFGALSERVASFMRELDTELWKLGVPSKMKHKEVAPTQFEIVPIFSNANLANDHNQIIMETLKKIALRHDFVCLLHEKPYEGINGSGKHNNWSLSTDDGHNLLKPGKVPAENIQFLTFFCAVVAAVDKYAGLLRASAASVGNERRLGGHEAPPCVISAFLGDDLTKILDNLVTGAHGEAPKKEIIHTGVAGIADLFKDTTDRNRTSPFAFTGNKFEFRMCPSSSSISRPNTTLNTIVADVLKDMADRLENAADFETELHDVLVDLIQKHKRIIFNGNGYSEEWLKEAQKRGLKNITKTVDALSEFVTPEAFELFERHGIYSREELTARFDIYCSMYLKQVNIEAKTMIDMTHRMILPSTVGAAAKLSRSVTDMLTAEPNLNVTGLKKLLMDMTSHIAAMQKAAEKLQKSLNDAEKKTGSTAERARYFNTTVIKNMEALRAEVDALEKITPKEDWCMPTYSDILL